MERAETLLSGRSEMAAFMRARFASADHPSGTALGSIDTWPTSLKIALRILLNSDCPMFLVWGCDRLLFYNDAYARLLPREYRQALLGQPISEAWRQHWRNLSLDIEQVFASGQSCRREQEWLPIYPDDSSTRSSECLPQDSSDDLSNDSESDSRSDFKSLYTWSYSALWDEEGGKDESVSGVFASGYQVTAPAIAVATEQQDETVRSLLRISQKLNSTLDINLLLDVLTEEAIGLINVEGGCSGLYTPEGMVCHKYFQKGKVLPLRYCWPPGHGLPGWLILHKVPYLTNHALTDLNIVGELRLQFGVWSALSTPILSAQGEILGFFEVHNKRDGTGFTQSDQEKLVAVSQMAAIAIQNALSYQELQRTEEMLHAREERLRLITNALPVVIAYVDRTQHYRFGNQVYETWFGQPVTEIIGKHVREVLGEPAYAAVLPYIERVLTGEQVSFESQIPYRDGGTRYISANYIPHINSQNAVEGYIGWVADISERKRIEDERKQTQQELQQTLQTLSTLIKASPLPIIVIQPDMVVRLWNPAAEELFGWSETEVLGHPLPIVPPEKRDECRQVREAVARGEVFTNVKTYRHRQDHSPVTVSISAAPLYDEQHTLDAILLLFQDITEYQQATEALSESEKRFRALADNIAQLVWMADETGQIFWYNQRWFDYTGTTLAEMANWGWQKVYHPDYAEGAIAKFQSQIEAGEAWEDVFPLRGKDGKYRWFLSQAIPIRDEPGEELLWFGTHTDITDRLQAEQERERLLEREQAARQEAETANRIKDEFLAVLSHELRSPLNPILGWAKLLQAQVFDPEKTRQALETIERNAMLQAQLIEDLLDVSRILRGKLSLNIAPVSLESAIEAALETVRLAAEAKDIRLQAQLDRRIGLVMGDVTRLQQIVWNLLSNAVKFTPSGGTVTIQLTQTPWQAADGPAAAQTWAQISVIDTGKGIDPEFLPYVFEYFRQEDSTTTRRFGGLGLGLAIVRHLTELHGGSVQVESPGDELGTTFIVRLPVFTRTKTPEPQAENTALNPQPLMLHGALTGLNILVVDDEPDVRELVSFVLKRAGARVSTAASASATLRQMEQSLPDVLVCDIGMPEQDGYMLIRQIRGLSPQQGGQIPAIALTAYAGSVNQQQAIAAGFQLHLAKPVEPETLVRAIAALVRQA